MSLTARNLQENTPQEQEKPAPKPWKRQEGESTLWYNRYCLYQDLGYKRTVQAAVELERSKFKALRSTDIPPVDNKKRRKTPQNAALVEVPQPKPVQVPGSWKQASIAWNWIARARAWDAYCIDFMVEKNMEQLLENNHTLPMARIGTLQSMLTALSNTYNASNHKMTYEQDCLYIGRMQSLLRDIREEMRVYDESLQRAVTYRRCVEVYQTVDHTTYEEVKQEQARRKAAKKAST
jgi:hypothetical protein